MFNRHQDEYVDDDSDKLEDRDWSLLVACLVMITVSLLLLCDQIIRSHVRLQPAYQFLTSMAEEECPTLAYAVPHFEKYISHLRLLRDNEAYKEYASTVQEAIDIATANYYYGVLKTDAYAISTCECP